MSHDIEKVMRSVEREKKKALPLLQTERRGLVAMQMLYKDGT